MKATQKASHRPIRPPDPVLNAALKSSALKNEANKLSVFSLCLCDRRSAPSKLALCLLQVAPRRTNDCCWLLLVSSAEAVLDLTEIKILKANGGAKGVQLLEGPRRQTGQLCKRCQRKGLKEGDTYCSLECKASCPTGIASLKAKPFG